MVVLSSESLRLAPIPHILGNATVVYAPSLPHFESLVALPQQVLNGREVAL